jgi:hypothetical protein
MRVEDLAAISGRRVARDPAQRLVERARVHGARTDHLALRYRGVGRYELVDDLSTGRRAVAPG